MSMSDEERGFDDAIAQEESFLLEDALLPPEAEEPCLVEPTDIPAIPIVPANADLQVQKQSLPRTSRRTLLCCPTVRTSQ